MKWGKLQVDYEREAHRMRNYGDDIQIAAIDNVYRHMGVTAHDVVRIKFSDLMTYDGDYVVLPINYPFYGTYAGLSKKIIPVYLGLSLLSDAPIESLRLRQSEPIGCRDAYTLNVLREADVDAYLNGCMTLTFPRRAREPENGKVFFVDVCDELLEYAPQSLIKDAVFMTHLLYHSYVTEHESLAVLDRYKQEARLVVTSRLHCAVPCIAMGIPVIYACKEISFRSWWLENIIPLYDRNQFSSINWRPQPIECESLKTMMLDNAARRMRQAWDTYEPSLMLSSLLESKNAPDYTIEALRSSYRYLKKNWDPDRSHTYVIWGNTQTADLLYGYISEHYPRAELVGIIDLFQDMPFHGLVPQGLELLDKEAASTVFVSAESANVMALSEFEKRNKKDFVLCWEKLDYDLDKQR